MTHRVVIRLAIAAGGLVTVAIVGLTALIFATSAPELPPPPLPTATPAPVAGPNGQVQARIAAGTDRAAALADLAYADTAHSQAANPPCGRDGRWSLDVNPQDAVGYPYAVLPSARDWARAATAIGTANAICPAAVVLTWYGHDPARPRSDTWTALLPASAAAAINGQTLRRYALRHARQM